MFLSSSNSPTGFNCIARNCAFEFERRYEQKLIYDIIQISVKHMRTPCHLGRSSEAKNRKNPTKVKFDQWMDQQTDQQTDRPTDGPTNGPTKRVFESHSTRLKTTNSMMPFGRLRWARASLVICTLFTSVGRLVDRSVGWSVGRLVGWSVGWSVPHCNVM